MAIEIGTRAIAFTCFALIAIYLLLRPSPPSRSLPKGAPAYQRTIVAVGDLHADYENMMAVLKMAEVVSDDGSWSGKVDYWVQTGDIVDRGDDTIKMFRYIEQLRVQAQAAGGTIVSHLGNHEVMNLIGDWRYVPQTEIRTFGGVETRQRVWSKGWLGKAFRANYSVTSRVPLHPAVGKVNTDYDPSIADRLQDLSHSALSFVHGGLAHDYPDLTPYPSAINELGASLVQKLQERAVQPPPHPPNPYPGLPGNATAAEHELYGGNGPLWYRGWAMDKEAVVCSHIDEVIEKIGVKGTHQRLRVKCHDVMARFSSSILAFRKHMEGSYQQPKSHIVSGQPKRRDIGSKETMS